MQCIPCMHGELAPGLYNCFITILLNISSENIEQDCATDARLHNSKNKLKKIRKK